MKGKRLIIFFLVLSFIASGAATYASYAQVQASQHRWCATLELLTAKPVPSPADPAANPSRLEAYVLYTDFRSLRQEFCGS
ncbi:MAG: hypothetical protein ACRDP5_28330 [Streptosporangiaceae bacterium]